MNYAGQYFVRFCLAASILSISAGLYAAPVTSTRAASNVWYRYYNEKGVPTLSDQITEEHVRRGYEILDRNMQVTGRVAAFNNEIYLKEKARREAQMRQKMDDERIMKLYSSSRDAESARNRLLDTLETSIGYNRIQLIRLKRLRSELVEQGAESERTGKSLTAKQKDLIVQYDSQIKDLMQLMSSQEDEKNKVSNDFAPIINRLIAIEKSRKDGTYDTDTGGHPN
ncbi:hypothetical protein EV700_1374 [Fluviicoccus keumensis]|uniref:DUF4124 domain-containing protein n=1 Tax=Fluviicoccus keumensis TaxID=1435465 RepID=A0A4Q7Z8Y8_9GAMM|nr:hypothetical protein [Fluviicoccus keumensis]RZU46987.1 hypothetical protein EV700_1374 [Fluviicoccus keumensis]